MGKTAARPALVLKGKRLSTAHELSPVSPLEPVAESALEEGQSSQNQTTLEGELESTVIRHRARMVC